MYQWKTTFHVVQGGLLNKYSMNDTFVEYVIINDSNQYYEEEEDKLIQYRNKRNN